MKKGPGSNMKRKRLRVKQSAKETVQTQITGRNGNGSHLVKHGAYSLLHAFNAGKIDRRSSLGQLISGMESEYATHMGYSEYADCPITLREKIRLLIGEWILQSFIIPSQTNMKDLRASINTLNRTLTELGLVPTSREIQLQEYLNEKKTRRKTTS